MISDGTGAMLIPAGWVKGRVVRADGKRLGENDLLLDSTSSVPGHCGGGDIGFGDRATTAPSNTRARPATRTILVMKSRAEGEWYPIGSATVKVRAGKTVKVTIHLTEAP